MQRVLSLLALSLVLAPNAAQAACPLAPIGKAHVAAVRDGRTILLADGRVLRLAAIEITGKSREALAGLIGSRALRLARLGPERDRYGRLVAFAFAGDDRQSLQQRLLAAGQARVAARVGEEACAKPLLAAERAARQARRGQWRDPNFAPLAAESSAGLERRRGRFTLIEGKILSVHQSAGTIYLNFGRRWTRDFSVAILRRNAHIFAAAGLDPAKLAGRRVLVRGFVEMRRGPIIEADAPEQIELAGEGP